MRTFYALSMHIRAQCALSMHIQLKQMSARLDVMRMSGLWTSGCNAYVWTLDVWM